MSITIDTNASKTSSSSVYPLFALDSSPFSRVEPLISPERLQKQYLFSIPLKTALTKQELTSTDLKDFIIRAVNEAEMDLQISIVETQHIVKLPYDRPLTNYYNYLEVPIRPITRLDALTIESADQQTLFTYPASIIEGRQLHLGTITIGLATSPTSIPATILSAVSPNGSSIVLTNAFLQQRNTPAYFSVKFSSGFNLAKVPIPINDLIATIAAINIISTVAPSFRTNAASMSIDGLSQSSSGPGPNIFTVRMQELMQKKAQLEQTIRGYYYTSIKVSNL